MTCELCGELGDRVTSYQKGGRPEETTLLPPAVDKLIRVKPASWELLQCPTCGDCFSYEHDREYLTNGDEEESVVKRLSDEAASALLAKLGG